MIEVKGLNYLYKSYLKGAGLKGSFRDFFKREFQNVSALKEVNLSIPKGQIVGLLGPNGAGKTTLIKILCGILAPGTGEVKVNLYKPYLKEAVFLKGIGLVLGQKSQLLWDLPALETLLMLKVMYEIKEEDFQQRLAEMMNVLNLEKKLHVPVKKLSLGERIKFELVCAMIHQPPILFLDEPTIGLDITSQKHIYQFIRQINQDKQTTILLTSHYLIDMEELAERILIILEGQLVADTTLEKLQKFHQVSGRYQIIFKEEVPAFLRDVGIVDQNKLELSEQELIDYWSRLEVEKILSLKLVTPELADILYQIFTEGEWNHEKILAD